MKKEKTKILKEKYAGSFGGKRDKPDQPNLFGDQDFVFSALQEEMSVIHAMIERTIESIDKKKELLQDLKRRKQQLDKAAVIIKKSKHLLKPGDKEEIEKFDLGVESSKILKEKKKEEKQETF